MAIRLLSTTAISCKANTNNDVGEWQRRKKQKTFAILSLHWSLVSA